MQFVGQELLPPSWTNEGKISFFFGTDDIGRDVFSRIIIGTSYTLGASLVVVCFTIMIGTLLGIWAGISHSVKSKILGHFLDTFLSIPSLLIAIIIATLMKPSLINAILATTLALLPYFIHEIYQATQHELKKEYVLMLKLDGISNKALLKEIILPNISVRYIQEIARAFAIAILKTRYQRTQFYLFGGTAPYARMGCNDQRFFRTDLSRALDRHSPRHRHYFNHFSRFYFQPRAV